MNLGSRNVGARWTGRLGAVALIALAITPTATRAMDLFVRGVRDGQPAFGVVEIDVEVLSLEPIERVELVVDGASVGELRSPPYRWQVDLGEENRGHAFEVTVEDASGAVETRLVETPPILVHQALDLGLQQLYATVTRDGRRILDLDREAFEVRDDGVPQTLVTFEGGDVPFTAVLLVDTSTSMRGDQLSTAISGARGFVARMRELDQAQVILFSDRVVAESPFTDDPEAITAALQGARAAGGTAVNDHLYLALKRLEARQGRRVIVLLGDGRDIESVLTMDDVAWKAGRVQPLVYWIRPRPEGEFRISSAWRDPEGHAEELAALAALVENSGGRIHDIDSPLEASTALGAVLEELREQYVFGYYPSEQRGTGAWHRVRVRPTGGGLRVRVRDGYFEP